MRLPLIAIDFSTLDHLNLGNGQYRYCVNLIIGLNELEPDAKFVVLGSNTLPVPELQDVMNGSGDRWRYRQLDHHHGRASYWRDQILYARILQSEGIGLYHSLHGLMPLIRTCPAVITQYDLMAELFPEYEEGRNSRPYRINRWAVRRYAKRIICISSTTAEDMHRLWAVEPDRLDVVQIGTEFIFEANTDAVSSRTRSQRASTGHYFLLSPYNLEPRKNLRGLLLAVARLRDLRPNLRLILFGRAAITPEREFEFETTISDLGLESVIERTGFLDDSRLRRLYCECTLFVFPSLYEGFGLPVIEAMAQGACVIARDASAMAEVVGNAGTLVETADPEALATAISSLLDNPDRRVRLGLAAHERSLTFTINRMARMTLASYCKALDN